jgi:hypothetical protein
MKRRLLLIFFIFLVKLIQAQTIPIGTIIKGKRLPSLFVNVTSTSVAADNILQGVIKLNDSKLTINETGFVILSNNSPGTPTISNGRRVIVSAGVHDFSANIDDLPPSTTYKVRAYAINAKNEIAYSNIFIRTTEINFCYVNPCKNGGTCISTLSGPLCQCTNIFCGNCCAQLASDFSDPTNFSCPGSSLNSCPDLSNAKIKQINKIKINESLVDRRTEKNIWSLKSQEFKIESNIPTR